MLVPYHSRKYLLLELINKVFDSTALISQYTRRGKLESAFVLVLRSKKLFGDLQNLGGIRRKSLIMKFPNVPDQYLADFIRGYFDGDGSVYFTTYLRTKDHRKQVDLRCNFTSGSPAFLNKLRDLLTKILGLFPRKVCSYGDGNQWKLEYAGKDARALLNFIYYPQCELFLARKAEFLKRI